MVLDLKDGTTEITGNEAEIDQSSHVVKDAKALKNAWREIFEAREEQGFDGHSLSLDP